MRAGELALPGFGHPPPAGRAGGGAATLIHHPHYDAGPLGLVAQRLQEVAAAPPAQAQVLDPANIPVSDSCGVAHHEGSDLVLHSEGDDLSGGLVLGLLDAAAMA